MKCRACIDGDCHLCTRYAGSVEVSGEQVEDCCCLHQFDATASVRPTDEDINSPAYAYDDLDALQARLAGEEA